MYIALPMFELTQTFAGWKAPMLPLEAFEQVWMHVLMAYLLFAAQDFDLAYSHIAKASDHLDKGILAISRRVRACNVQSIEYCPPESVAALCVRRLTKGVVGEQRDFADIYKRAVLELASLDHSSQYLGIRTSLMCKCRTRT